MKVAVAGVGSFGQHHARIMNDLDDVELVAVVDANQARAEEIAGNYGVKAYDSLGQVLNKIDAAIIATPTTTHKKIAEECLEAGINIFVEKPIAATSKEASSLIEKADAKNLVFHVGHVERFNPAFLTAKQFIQKPLYLEARRISSFPARIQDTDVVLDMMIHDIDIVLNIVGEKPEDIKAIGMKVLTDKSDMAQVRLEFPSGVVANLSSSRVSESRFRKLRVYEKNRYLSIDFLNRSAYWAEVVKRDSEKKIDIHKPESYYVEPLHLELTNFFSAIKGEDNIGVTGKEGYDALVVAEKITKEMRLQ